MLRRWSRVLAGQIGCSQPFERHPERDVLDDPAAQADVGEQKVFRVDDRGPVGDADHEHRQLEQTLEHLGPLGPGLLPCRWLEDLAKAGSVDPVDEGVAGPGDDECLVVSVKGDLFECRGKSACVWPVNTIGPPFVWKRSTSTPSSSLVNARFSYFSK
jgi:hypothetical protein